MRIPYISLRFTKKDVQTWGLQFLRFTRRDNENADFWNPVSPNVSGFVNQFGELDGLTAASAATAPQFLALCLRWRPLQSGRLPQNARSPAQRRHGRQVGR
jgi:hypothetical protein